MTLTFRLASSCMLALKDYITSYIVINSLLQLNRKIYLNILFSSSKYLSNCGGYTDANNTFKSGLDKHWID